VSEVPEIRTERLLMRAWRDEDFEPYTAVARDPLVAESLGKPDPPEPPEVWRDMAFLSGHWQLKGFGHWALEELESGKLVGHAGLLRPPDWPDLEVGWTVAPEHWGKGYAPEAGRAACEWAHEQLGARHIVSLIHPDNVRSQRVAEKLGETVEGRFQLRQLDLLVYGSDLPLRAAGTTAA
jgi:RimJ/RimL family protein N-acetyltransferase